MIAAKSRIRFDRKERISVTLLAYSVKSVGKPDRLPLSKFLAQGPEPLFEFIVCVFAQNETKRWLLCSRNLVDGLRRLARVAGRLPLIFVKNASNLPTVFAYSGRRGTASSERPMKSVRKGPGSTTVTLMPKGASSPASASDAASSAAFVAP